MDVHITTNTQRNGGNKDQIVTEPSGDLKKEHFLIFWAIIGFVRTWKSYQILLIEAPRICETVTIEVAAQTMVYAHLFQLDSTMGKHICKDFTSSIKIFIYP